MPIYGTFTLPTALNPGDQLTLWNAEAPATIPARSIAFCRAPGAGQSGPTPMMFTIQAAAATVEIQGSNDDVPANYQTLYTTTNLADDFYEDAGSFAFYSVLITSLSSGKVTVKVQR